MPTTARRKAEARKKRGHVWQLFASVLMSLIPSMVPKSPAYIMVALIVVFAVGIQAARYGYVDKPSPRTLAAILAAHALALFLFGWLIRPQIRISPQHVLFQGFPNETLDFSVKNERDDDVYDIQIPFLIGYGRHLDDKFSAKILVGGDVSRRFIAPYNYCYGKGKDIHKVMPKEQEVFVVTINHLAPSGIGSFTITYAGGDKIETKPGVPDFLSEPYSYSDTQGTIGIRGDYRTCKMIVAARAELR